MLHCFELSGVCAVDFRGVPAIAHYDSQVLIIKYSGIDGFGSCLWCEIIFDLCNASQVEVQAASDVINLIFHSVESSTAPRLLTKGLGVIISSPNVSCIPSVSHIMLKVM